jgi:hypothetical protein
MCVGTHHPPRYARERGVISLRFFFTPLPPRFRRRHFDIFFRLSSFFHFRQMADTDYADAGAFAFSFRPLAISFRHFAVTPLSFFFLIHQPAGEGV